MDLDIFAYEFESFSRRNYKDLIAPAIIIFVTGKPKPEIWEYEPDKKLNAIEYNLEPQGLDELECEIEVAIPQLSRRMIETVSFPICAYFQITINSFTISGKRSSKCCCCSGTRSSVKRQVIVLYKPTPRS